MFSLILRKLVEDAERTLRQPVDSAVITVPANWKDGPRRATEAAGRLAGLKVERLINEPTAAAMAYGMRDDADGKTIAIYDLGGGTFDISILRIHQKVFDVVTSNGDDRLGGVDFDQKLMALIFNRLKDRTGFSTPSEDDADDKMRQRLRDLELVCEQAKIELSFTGETEVTLPFFAVQNGQPIDIEEQISRKDLEGLIEEDVQRTLKYMESAVLKSKLPREAIDEVVLVGGSSRIPLVRQRVAEFFGKEPLTSAVNPDEAIALGAAIQAGIISQDEVSEDSFVVLDVVNNSLGLDVVSNIGGRIVPGIFSKILEKDTKVPTSNTDNYSTASDNQEAVLLRCFEGEAPVVDRNTLLDEIQVGGLPLRPAGEVTIDVTFKKTISDLLEVGWTVEGTDIQGSHTIQMRSGLHSEEELDRRKQVLDGMWSGGSKGHDRQGKEKAPKEPKWTDSPMAAKYKGLIQRIEAILTENSDFPTRTGLESNLAQLKGAVVAGDENKAEELDLLLTDILFDLE